MWFLCGLVEQFHDVSCAFHAFVAGVSLSSLAFALGALPSARILHSRGWPVGVASCLAHLREDLHVKIPPQITQNPGIFGHLCNFSNMFESFVFPQQHKLGVFSHSKVKVPGQAGAAKSARRKVGNRPRKGFLFQENLSEQPNPLGASLGTGFAGRGSQARFPGKDPQAKFPGRGSQVRFPSGSQEQVPKQRSPARGSQEHVPKQGSQEEVPSKVPKQGSQEQIPKQGFPARGSKAGFPGKEITKKKVFRKRFPGKVPKRFPARFPGTGSQPRVPQAEVPNGQARAPRKRFPSKVLRKKQGFPGRGFHDQVPKQGSQGQVCKQASQEQAPKQGFE